MPSAARFSSLWTAGRVSGFGPSTLMCPIPVTHTHTPLLTVPGWVGPLSGGGGVRVLDLPLPPTGMLAALGLAIRRPSPPSPPFAPDRSLSPPFAARAVLHAFIQSRASGHGLCAPSPLMGIASVTSQITDHSCSSFLARVPRRGRAPRPPPAPLGPFLSNTLPWGRRTRATAASPARLARQPPILQLPALEMAS